MLSVILKNQHRNTKAQTHRVFMESTLKLSVSECFFV